MSGLCRLIGARVGTGGEGRWQRPLHPLVPLTSHMVGLDAVGKTALSGYLRDFGVNADPIFQRLQRVPGKIVTHRRPELVSDREWYRSKAFTDYRRCVDCDHQVTSICEVSKAGAMSCLALHRVQGERDFSERECALLTFFHFELGRLIGRSLVTAFDRHHMSLSPRLRETLRCLMEGDSEKQASVRMGISRATVHQYVTVLYRRFDVQSRAELLVRVLRRHVLP